MAVVFPAGIEVFGNCSSCVAGSSSGTTNPGAGTTESWTMGTGYTTFPVAQNSSAPNNYFYIRDPADATNEILLVYVNGGNNSSWSVQRGMNGATVAHATGATWVQVVSPFTLAGFKQASNAAISPVTITTSTTETVLANYQPTAADIEAGASFEIIAFGPLTFHGGATHTGTLTFNVYWGGSGSPGSSFTSTGSQRVASLLTGTNTPGIPSATTLATGSSFDVNGTLNIQAVSAGAVSSVHCNLNTWLAAATSLATAPLVGTCTDVTTAGGASGAGPVSVTAATGPIILTAAFSGGWTVYGLTAVGPLIYRAA